MIFGVDVSAIQGVVPWQTLAANAQAIRFAYLRCKVGNDPGRDSRFVANALGAAAAGILPGAYCFAYPLPHLKPEDQVSGFMEASLIPDVGYYANGSHHLGDNIGELPMALDLEWPPPEGLKKPDGTVGKGWREWGCDARQILRWSLAALADMRERLGYEPVVYTYPHFMKRIAEGVTADELAELAQYPLWIAGGKFYEAGNAGAFPIEGDKPPIPKPWGDHKIWQFDGNGGLRLPGSGADADFNAFNGTLEELRKFAELPEGVASMAPPPMLDAIAVANRHIVEEDIRAYRAERETD